MTDTTTKARWSLHLFGRDFIPKLLPSVFLLLFVPMFCALGTWQYHRAVYKKQRLSDLASRQSHKALTINDIDAPKRQEFYPVTASGRLLNGKSLLVQNKYYQHKPGFVVLTPMQLSDGSQVLINRGWIARDKTAKITQSSPQVSVTGIVHVPAPNIFQIGELQTQVDGLTAIQNNSKHEIDKALPNSALKPFQIVLNHPSEHAFTPIFTPTIMPPAKHFGYSVQWFAMALAVAGIFIWTGFKH